MIVLKEPIEFEWDKGNPGKNSIHKVQDAEAEELFFDPNKKLFNDVLHSSNREPRYILIGQTKEKRLLFTAFTIRNNKVRIISARDIHSNSKERKLYEEET